VLFQILETCGQGVLHFMVFAFFDFHRQVPRVREEHVGAKHGAIPQRMLVSIGHVNQAQVVQRKPSIQKLASLLRCSFPLGSVAML
jgi:hypothetical protein